MYPIPSDLNLSEMVGSEIESIALGPFNVNFSFGEGSVICVQGRIEVSRGDNIVATWSEEDRWSTVEFQSLFQRKLESFTVVNDQLLTLAFGDHLVLRLHNDTPQYEAFQIYLKSSGGKPIIV